MSGYANTLTMSGFATRLVFALLLVLLTYNPSEFSFLHWIKDGMETPLVYKVIAGIVLLIGWVIYIRATKNSLGVLGTLLAIALLACLVWLLIELGMLQANNVTAMTWAGELVLALLLAIGMSWSHIRRRMTGQVDTDEIES